VENNGTIRNKVELFGRKWKYLEESGIISQE